jgi:hypothetical protein
MDLINEVILVRNDNHKIAETNYWDSEKAKKGFYYMSLNAGYYRLLVPEGNDSFIKEISTANEVVISRGPAQQMNPPRPDAFEIMFEDGSDCPYSITSTPDCWESYPGKENEGWFGKFAVYCKSSKDPVIEFTRVYYRRVKSLPCLEPVKE